MSRGLRPGRGAQAELSDALRAGHKPNFAARLLAQLGGPTAPVRPGERRKVAMLPPVSSAWRCPIHSRRLEADRTCPAPGTVAGSRSCARLGALVHAADWKLVGPWLGTLPAPTARTTRDAGCGCEVCEALRPLPLGADVRPVVARLLPDLPTKGE